MANLRAELKAELESVGAFSYRPGLVYLKAAFLLAVTVALFAGAALAPSWWLKVPLFLVGIATNIGLVMIGHDAGHGAVSRHKWTNDALGYALFTLIGGLPLVYWKWKHNTMHHSFPNVAGKDPDVDIYPYAMNTEQRVERGFKGFVQRHQGLLFWPIALLAVFTMRVDGLLWHLGKGRRLAPAADRYVDYVVFVLHHVCWLVVPTALFGVPFAWALGFYCAWTLAAGVLLAAIFLPAHMEAPIYRGYDENFVLQLRTTQNLLTNPVFSFLLIGLDHQVEHHLFQRMSHLNVKRAAPVVRAFCARRGLPYEERGWGAALWATTKRLDALPHYELVERPPREDAVAMSSAPVEKGRAEFSDGREPLEEAPAPA
jgi:fatty acid desaturase